MKKELDEYLVTKYPKIFRDRYEDKKITAMCWGFDCEDGWFFILDQMCNSIQNYIDYNSKKVIIKNKFLRVLDRKLRKIIFQIGNKKYLGKLCYKFVNLIDSKSKKIEIETISQVVATQVKEKFGGLCFYYYGGDDYISGMISLAEHMSYNICETCGSTDHVGRTNGWIYTICKDCYDKADTRIKNHVWKENLENK